MMLLNRRIEITYDTGYELILIKHFLGIIDLFNGGRKK